MLLPGNGATPWSVRRNTTRIVDLTCLEYFLWKKSAVSSVCLAHAWQAALFFVVACPVSIRCMASSEGPGSAVLDVFAVAVFFLHGSSCFIGPGAMPRVRASDFP